MVQTKLPDRGRDSSGKIVDATFIRRVRQHDQTVHTVAFNPGGDVTGTSQTATNRLGDATQAGIGGVTTEDFQVGRKIVQRECHQGQARFLPGGDGPVMLKHLAKRRGIQQSGDGVIAGQVTDAALGLQECLLDLGIDRKCAARRAAPVRRVVLPGIR